MLQFPALWNKRWSRRCVCGSCCGQRDIWTENWRVLELRGDGTMDQFCSRCATQHWKDQSGRLDRELCTTVCAERADGQTWMVPEGVHEFAASNGASQIVHCSDYYAGSGSRGSIPFDVSRVTQPWKCITPRLHHNSSHTADSA